MNVIPTSCWIRLSSSCISWRSLRSSAPSGSSSSSTRGPLTIARASATRWRWPPESCAGLRAPSAREADQLERLLGAPAPLRLGDLAHAQPVGDVLRDGHVREQRVVLEDRVDVARVGRQVLDLHAPELDAAAVGQLEAGDQPQRRRLARPGRAEQREELAVPDLERDAVDRLDLAVALDQVGQAHVGGVRGSRWPSERREPTGGVRHEQPRSAVKAQGRSGCAPNGRGYDPRVLAYLFWHAHSPAVAVADYEARLEAFHAALRAGAPAGLGPTLTFALGAVPWLQGGPGYEDWYLVEDFAALGTINAAAVSGAAKAPHDAAAARGPQGRGRSDGARRRAAAARAPGLGGVARQARGGRLRRVPRRAGGGARRRGERLAAADGARPVERVLRAGRVRARASGDRGPAWPLRTVVAPLSG